MESLRYSRESILRCAAFTFYFPLLHLVVLCSLGATPNAARRYNAKGELVMSRSMIERRELKISPQDTQPENCHFPVGQGKYANSNGHISRMSLAKNGEALKQNGRLRASLFSALSLEIALVVWFLK